jgi:glycosyltransferase involved in cell wall biosynthesis
MLIRPLVSVIIPVYNGERYLGEAIDSVLAQTYRPIEVIVVDDGSTDNSAEIAQSYQEVFYIFQSNMGVSMARNTGLEAAQAEFIAFLDSDDIWTTEKLARQIDHLMHHSEIQYTISSVKFFLEADHSVPSGCREEWLGSDHVGRILSTLVARKSLFDVIGKFDPKLTTAEDVEWFARANAHEIPQAVIPKILLHKRIHSANLSLSAPGANRDLLKALKQSIDSKRNQELVTINAK